MQRQGSSYIKSSAYIVVPYWLLYLNFKLSHFSDIWQAFIANCISWSRRKEGRQKERGPLLLFNPLRHWDSNTLSSGFIFFLPDPRSSGEAAATDSSRERTNFLKHKTFLKGQFTSIFFLPRLFIKDNYTKDRKVPLYCGNADVEIYAEWQKEATTFRAFFFALLDNTSRPSNA